MINFREHVESTIERKRAERKSKMSECLDRLIGGSGERVIQQPRENPVVRGHYKVSLVCAIELERERRLSRG